MNQATKPGALVTGGSKRIGRAIVEGLAAAGCRVAIHANHSVEDAEDLAEAVDGAVVIGDLSDPSVAETMVDAAAAALGTPIQFVVNNASEFLAGTPNDVSVADFDAMMHLHAWAPLVICRAAAEQGAEAVVNILDTRIASQDLGHAAYILSKQALAEMTKMAAVQWAPMRVNGVAPGPILPPADGGNLDAAVEATILRRTGTPEEVAGAVAFMLQATYTTGDVLFVDGGRHLK